MIDIDTFLTYLYVMVDDFCKQHPSCVHHPGPSASLTRSEVGTLAWSNRLGWYEGFDVMSSA